MKCPCSKSFIGCTIAGFIFIFVYEYVVHGILLMPTYEATESLWRPHESMKEPQFFSLSLITQIITAAVILFIFTQNFENKGVGEGVRFGLLIGLFMGVMMGSAYIWMPIPVSLGLSWLVAGLIQGLGLGVLYSLLYKDKREV